MSHFKERKEKNCLNCNAEVQGRYCQVCGQENLETFETAWHLVTHFFNDITHFDGKFFSTLKYLLLRPGFVSKEYMIGKRASYLNPVRMYVFTSAIFFLIFFSVNRFDENDIHTKVNGQTVAEITKMDSASFSAFTKKITGDQPMTRNEFAKYLDTVSGKGGIRMATGKYKTRAEYDSSLRSGKENDNWFERTLTYKLIDLNERYHGDGKKIMTSFVNALMHSFPQMLFISLPLFALMLKLLYSRRKKFYYASHVIFSIHLYVFVFIFLLLLMGLSQVEHLLAWDWINYLIGFGIVYIFLYQYKSMRNFYVQGRGKTILKFIILSILMFFLITMLFIIFSFFSLFKI